MDRQAQIESLTARSAELLVDNERRRAADADAACDAFLAERRADRERSAREKRASARMLEETRLRGMVDQRLGDLADMVGELTGALVRDLKKEIGALRDEVGQLRAELTMQSAIARGQVTELKTRDTDAA